MHARFFGLASAMALGLLLTGACGDDDEEDCGDGLRCASDPDGGMDGGSPEASDGTGGTGSGGQGSGGASTTGGAAATGGSGGTGSQACAAPAGANQAALCLTFSPEDITFLQDPAYDGSGWLAFQVFAVSDPPEGDAAEAIALDTQAFPADPTGGMEVSLDALPSARVVLDDAPDTVYVRAFFADNPAAFTDDSDIVPGVWVGGLDLSDGLREGIELSPIPITVGAGTAADIPLTAIRRLDVTVTSSVAAVGDGEGPLGVVLTKENQIGEGSDPAGFGFATLSCADIADAPIEFSGLFIGSGRYYVTAALDDLLLGGPLPLGSLSSLTLDPGGQSATIPTSVDVAQGDYTAEVTVDLNLAVPLPPDSGAPGPNACSDLPADGGT